MKDYIIRVSFDLDVRAPSPKKGRAAVLENLPDYYRRHPEVGFADWEIEAQPATARIESTERRK